MRKLLETENAGYLTWLRIVLGLVIFPHGAQKALGWFGGHGFEGTMKGFTEGLHIPAVFALLAIAAEFLGALGLITGLLSRVAAFGLLVVMGVAVLQVHLGNGFFMNWEGTQKGEGFEYHILFAAIALVILVKGAGAWSLDRAITARQSA